MNLADLESRVAMAAAAMERSRAKATRAAMKASEAKQKSQHAKAALKRARKQTKRAKRRATRAAREALSALTSFDQARKRLVKAEGELAKAMPKPKFGRNKTPIRGRRSATKKHRGISVSARSSRSSKRPAYRGSTSEKKTESSSVPAAVQTPLTAMPKIGSSSTSLSMATS